MKDLDEGLDDDIILVADDRGSRGNVNGRGLERDAVPPETLDNGRMHPGLAGILDNLLQLVGVELLRETGRCGTGTDQARNGQEGQDEGSRIHDWVLEVWAQFV